MARSFIANVITGQTPDTSPALPDTVTGFPGSGTGMGVGAGEGAGAGVGGVGEGLGVWARVSSGNFVAATPAAPRAGSIFTNVRRVVLFFFMFLAADLPG